MARQVGGARAAVARPVGGRGAIVIQLEAAGLHELFFGGWGEGVCVEVDGPLAGVEEELVS